VGKFDFDRCRRDTAKTQGEKYQDSYKATHNIFPFPLLINDLKQPSSLLMVLNQL
jgi:hypothetical protein